MRCFCGCGEFPVARHHVFYAQHLRGRGQCADPRNLVVVALVCHGRHHSGADGSWRYPLGLLPDSVFEFGVEVFGPGRAFEYLRRRYRGEDPRLDALLAGESAAA